MEISDFLKFIAVFITTTGSLTLALYNISQSKKITAELIEKFEDAIINNRRYTAIELFRIIHGVRLNYQEISEVINHEDCLKIILALKKSSGVVTFKDNKLIYTNLGNSSTFRFIDKWSTRVAVTILPIFFLGTLIMIFFGDNKTIITGLILMAVICVSFIYEIYDYSITSMISKLISKH